MPIHLLCVSASLVFTEFGGKGEFCVVSLGTFCNSSDSQGMQSWLQAGHECEFPVDDVDLQLVPSLCRSDVSWKSPQR